jgi:hypothetical protein
MNVPTLPEFSKIYAESEARLQQTAAAVTAKESEAQRLNRLLVIGPDQAEKVVQAERVAAIAAGKQPAAYTSLADAKAELADLKEAYSYQAKEHGKVRDQESMKLRRSLVPAVDVEQKKLASALVEVWSALRTIESITGSLESQNIGWFGIPVSLDIGRLFPSCDRTSELAVFIRDAAARGFVSLPKGI